jgi:hypothetical protein
MIDYLLKFPSKFIAEQFGVSNGFAYSDEDSGKVFSSLASSSHALHEIGDFNNDGSFWILFRDFIGIPIPDGAEQFIYWSSDWKVTDDAGDEIQVPRPEFNPDVPSVFWA